MIKGKQGRFRENLLGKRVDYSARSVIVVGPELHLHQCGLPKKIALELFQPFIIRRLKELGHADTIKSAKKMLERKADEVWDILEEVIKNHPVLLNRAPTLHRMGIQAFEPVLIEGNAIRIHPLVCKGFNADFDGDQMAVHLPLSIEAQVEATVLMMSTNNIFSPANGQPIITPSQDIVMGCYYLTADPLSTFTSPSRRASTSRSRTYRQHLPENLKGEGMKFASPARSSWRSRRRRSASTPASRSACRSRRRSSARSSSRRTRRSVEEVTAIRRTAWCRPPSAGSSSTTSSKPHMAFYDLALSGKHLSRIIADCYQMLGRRETIELLDRMKEIGFRESTRSGLSFSTDDLKTPPNKEHVIRDTEKEVEKIQKQYMRGIITELERYNKVIDLWTDARDKITKQMMHDLQHDVRGGVPYLNPIFLMAHSGARGGVEQIRQLAGMRGLMAKPSGPDHRDADQGQLPRGPERAGVLQLHARRPQGLGRHRPEDRRLRLPDAQAGRRGPERRHHHARLRHHAGHHQGRDLQGRGNRTASLRESIRGRVSRHAIITTITGEEIVGENEMITWEQARKIEALGIDKVAGPQPDDLRGAPGRLPALLRHGPGDRRRWSRKAWRSASSPPSRSASRARS